MIIDHTIDFNEFNEVSLRKTSVELKILGQLKIVLKLKLKIVLFNLSIS